MYRKTDKTIYKIYKKAMYDAEFRGVAAAYTSSVDRLEAVAQTFSAEQWAALREYQQAFTALHQVMMKIALQKKA